MTYVSDPHRPGNGSSGSWIVGGSAILSSTYNVETDTFSLETPSALLLGELSATINSQNSVPLTVTASVSFSKPAIAQDFVRYALARRPDGVRTWAFGLSGLAGPAVVDSRLQAQDDMEDEAAIQFLQDAFLAVLSPFRVNSNVTRFSFKVLDRNCGCHIFSLFGSLILINDLLIQLETTVRDISNYVNDFFVIQFYLPVLVGSFILNLELFFVFCHLFKPSHAAVSALLTSSPRATRPPRSTSQTKSPLSTGSQVGQLYCYICHDCPCELCIQLRHTCFLTYELDEV